MNFKTNNNILRRRYQPIDLNRRSSLLINPITDIEEEKVIIVSLPPKSEVPVIKRKKKKRNSKTVNEVSLA